MSPSDPLLVTCPSCGTENRVPREKLAQGLRPVCGVCKTPLPVSLTSEPLIVTDASFESAVLRSPLPVLVDLWAAWCGPCRMIGPVVDQLAAEMNGRLRVAKLNVDENPRTADQFHVRSIPALLIFKDGREVDRIVGVQPKAAIMQRLEPLLA